MKTISGLFLFILSFNLLAQDVFYQRCETISGKTTCERVNGTENFKTLTIDNIQVGQCFRKDENNMIIFYKITKVSKPMVWAVAQMVKKDNPKDWGHKLIADFYTWGGTNLNENLTPFSCLDTPSLGDEEFLKNKCGLNNNSRGTIFCETPRKHSSFGERDLSKEDVWK